MFTSPVVFALLFLPFTIIFSLIINTLFLNAYSNFNLSKHIDEYKVRWESRPKPSLGGFSFYIIFLFSISTFLLLFGNDFVNKQTIGILLSVSLAFVLGWADDVYGTNPILKFIGQFICANIVTGTGLIIPATNIHELDYIFTIFWLIGIMNSLNMLDNMDGVTSIVSVCTIIGAIGILMLLSGEVSIHFVLLIGVLGALIGFLYYNWFPSKMYMGDTGSQFLGMFLGVISIPLFWSHKDPGAIHAIQFKQFLIPLLVFLVTIIDTITVFIRRIGRGQSPFIGGKDHTTHHLYYLGIPTRWVCTALGALSLISTGIAVLIIKFWEQWTPLLTIGTFLYVIFVFITMQYLYDKGKERKAIRSRETKILNLKTNSA